MLASEYSVEEILRDGSAIHIRAIRPDDKPRLLDHFSQLSPRTVYLRFLGNKKRLSDSELQRFTELDFVRHVGLVATLFQGEDEVILGVGRYVRVDAAEPQAGDASARSAETASAETASAETASAEVAFTVRDDYAGRGIGSLLLDHLGRIARLQGVSEFQADVLGENNRMLRVFTDSGFQVQRSIDAGVVHVTFPTEETPQVSRVRQGHERIARAQSLSTRRRRS